MLLLSSLNGELSEASLDVAEVGEERVVCRAGNTDLEASFTVVSELDLGRKGKRLLTAEVRLDFDSVLGNTKILSLYEPKLDRNRSDILDDLVLDIKIIVLVVDDSENAPRLDVERHRRQNDFSSVEQKPRARALAFQGDLEVRNIRVDIRVVNDEQRHLLVVHPN